jgi:hypothetical protein
MLNINFAGSGHAAPKDPNLDTNYDFLQFPDPFREYIPGASPEALEAMADKNKYVILRAAMLYIDDKIKNHPPCNTCFKKLPKGRTFKEIWDSDKVWVNYFKDPHAHGEARGDFDIALADSAFQKGKMYVVAVIVHELAHIGGAPGGKQLADGKPNLMAESTLKCCLLSDYFDPKALGVIPSIVHGDSDTVYA